MLQGAVCFPWVLPFPDGFPTLVGKCLHPSTQVPNLSLLMACSQSISTQSSTCKLHFRASPSFSAIEGAVKVWVSKLRVRTVKYGIAVRAWATVFQFQLVGPFCAAGLEQTRTPRHKRDCCSLSWCQQKPPSLLAGASDLQDRQSQATLTSP